MSRIFENFVEKRQTKFHILKFRVCVNAHTKFELVKCTLSVSHNFQKSDSKFLQNRKSELSIDGLIISMTPLTFGVTKRQKFFVKWVKKCDLSALLNFASLSLKRIAYAKKMYIHLNFWSSKPLLLMDILAQKNYHYNPLHQNYMLHYYIRRCNSNHQAILLQIYNLVNTLNL